MSPLINFLADLPPGWRVVAIIGMAAGAHLLVRLLQAFSAWILTPRGASTEALMRRYPKVTTLTKVLVSALTFVIYFSAIGLIFQELGISLTAYLASASVIGLAVGFGSQGLVQDVVIGLTLIFSDVLDVGDMVDVSGQTGRVELVGLRFTVLVNLLDQRIYIPNRNITLINRYRKGYIRAYVDVQIPDGVKPQQVADVVTPLARGLHAQHRAVVLGEPEIMGVQHATPGGWRYLRLKFRLWPGQGALIENAFRQRLLAALRKLHPDYADWMVTVTYRAN